MEVAADGLEVRSRPMMTDGATDDRSHWPPDDFVEALRAQSQRYHDQHPVPSCG